MVPCKMAVKQSEPKHCLSRRGMFPKRNMKNGLRKQVKKDEKALFAALKNPTHWCTSEHCAKETPEVRGKFGVSYCDTYSMSHALPIIMGNALMAYAHYASKAIVRKDIPTIKRHAKAMYAWGETDAWDSLTKSSYAKKQKAWKEAMKWLTENMQGLWW